MKAIKGLLCAFIALFFCQVSFGQSSKSPQMRVNNGGDLEIVDSTGKVYTFKSITLQQEVVIDGISYKVSFGPGATSGDMVVILQPTTAAKLTVRDTDFPAATVGISGQALAIFTFNTQAHTMVVESGTLGSVTINNVTLKQGERVAVNGDGSLVRNLGSGSAPQTTTVAQNTPGQASETSNTDQPVPTTQDTTSIAGAGNNMLASFSINLSPEASTPYLP